MKPILYTILICTLVLACTRYPAGVEETLSQAGKNRSELEKVLRHYREHPEDSLKYQAACFQSLSDHLLVENTEAVVERAVCDVASAQLCAGLSRQESRADRLLNRVADNFAVLADSRKGVHRHGVRVACVAHDEL